ncbi:SsrA-binding protein SmpB [bacterium]|nr:SsrA-binding protein SmpB [bacterium]
MEILATNKKASWNYHILDTIVAGIVLRGAEVKATKNKKIDISGAYVIIRKGEAFLINASIAPYQPNNPSAFYDPNRTKKLLLKKREIQHLSQKIKEKGLTLIPLKVYNDKGLIKIELGLAKGKRSFDKRKQLKEREIKRKIARAKKENIF